MKLHHLILSTLSLILFSCHSEKESQLVTKPVRYVDTFIGTGGHGHTYPGATLPFGMVQLSPDTRLEGWDGCSGYHFSDSVIYGFSHTHLSGTGVSDYGDILLMPIQGPVTFSNGYKSENEENYSSPFSKKSEKASPGYYEVTLDKHNIDVQLSSTKRTGIHHYTFNEEGISKLLIDLEHRDMLIDHGISIVSENEVEGYRVSKAWAQEQHIYFVMRFSKAMISDSLNEKNTKAALSFDIKKGEKLMVKVGISAVDIEGARKNLNEEAQDWDFDKYREIAEAEWNKALTKIQVKDKDEAKKTIFYTALYHSMIAPNLFSDVDNRYRGMDQQIHLSTDGPKYTVFSLWDTFRATHPLFTLIEQERTNQFIRTFLSQYQSGGELPIWELAGNYTGCMIGYHSIPVIADAYIKGIRDYDINLAFEAMLHSANLDKLGLDAYKKQGFIASADEAESVSKNLEYAYDDWCISLIAKDLGKDSIYKVFNRRAQYYKNLFNPENGFMQSKMNAGWKSGFDPAEVNFNFTEANSWQYSMFVPQDVHGLKALYGGADKFEQKLDELFSTEVELSGRQQADITGLIGQYAHGNEPSHHMAYLYNYIPRPWKTQEKVNQILNEQYSNLPDGLSGNEDCGQMSSWYVLSSLGFYALSPGVDLYTIGTPHLDESLLNLENGNLFSVIANDLSKENFYIQSATLNGKDLNRAFLYHDEIMNGGELIFEMGPEPNKEWAMLIVPEYGVEDNGDFIPVPYLISDGQSFSDSMTIEIKSVIPESAIYYQLNGGEVNQYKTPIIIYDNAEINAFMRKNDVQSFKVKGRFKKIKGGRNIKLISEYSNQYSAGGENGLIDYHKGNDDFRTGYWQGFYNTDFEAIVDLGQLQEVKHISIGALQDIKSWIWYPRNVRVSVSGDNVSFKELSFIDNDFPGEEYGSFIKEFEKDLSKDPIIIRYVKIEAKNYGPCPEWHLGAGNPTWLFFDEITIE